MLFVLAGGLVMATLVGPVELMGGVVPAQVVEMQNQAKSTVSCMGTVCPTPWAEYPTSFEPSPYTNLVYPDCGVLATLCVWETPRTFDHSLSSSARLG